MVKLTPMQIELINVIKANPGIKLREMLEQVGYTERSGAASTIAKSLVDRGIVRRTGNKRNYQFYVDTDFDYELVKFNSNVATDEVDPLLDEARSVNLTEEQDTLRIITSSCHDGRWPKRLASASWH